MFTVFFIAWVAFSFLAHKLAKHYFQTVSRLHSNEGLAVSNLLTVAALLVTGVQLLSSGVLALIKVPKHDTKKKVEEPSLGVLLMVAIPHTFSVLTTNYSMALIPAASTHLIKVTEPMITAGIAWLIVRVTISKLKLLSVVLVLIGAVGASWDLHSTFPTDRQGLQLALLSTQLYAARNVTIKHLLGRGVVFEAATMGKVSLIGAMILLPICVVACTSVATLQCSIVTIAILGGSALCHAAYTYISTCVILQYVTVIGHALANVAKRVLVIVLFYLFGQQYYLSPIFVVVCCLGLLLYVKSSQAAAREASQARDVAVSTSLNKSRCIMIVVILTVIILVLVTLGVAAKTVPENTTRQLIDHPNEAEKSMLDTFAQQIQFQIYKTFIGHLKKAATTVPENTKRQLRLIDNPNNTDNTMKSMLNASTAVHEAQQIQLQIYKELIGHYRKAILVGLADHENLGDSAISVGEFEALKKLAIEVIYYCTEYKCGEFDEAKHAINNVMEPVVVLASGGGNFCIWKAGCALREKLIQAFPDREVLVLPQSVNFDSRQQMEAHADVMNTHPNITYLFRDHQSYNIIVNSGIFKYNKAVLCPDAAMQIGMIQPPNEPTHDIVWLKRKDMESLHSELPKFPRNLKVVVEDWVDTKTPKGENLKETSYKRLMTGVKFLSRGKVIVSDRLHAHILSVLLGKPNVILDNSYKKVTSFHSTWTPSVDNVLFASNATDAVEKAQYLLHKYY